MFHFLVSFFISFFMTNLFFFYVITHLNWKPDKGSRKTTTYYALPDRFPEMPLISPIPATVAAPPLPLPVSFLPPHTYYLHPPSMTLPPPLARYPYDGWAADPGPYGYGTHGMLPTCSILWSMRGRFGWWECAYLWLDQGVLIIFSQRDRVLGLISRLVSCS